MPFLIDDVLQKAADRCGGRHPARFLAILDFVTPADNYLEFFWADNTQYLGGKVRAAIAGGEQGTLMPFREIAILDTETREVIAVNIDISIEARG